MTYYIRSGDKFMITDESNIDIRTTLEAGNYVVKYDEPKDMFYLEKSDNFLSLPKYYGDTLSRAARILNTFADRPAGTGVMLMGEKGSGKSLLAKEIAIQGYAQGYPTILVNQAWVGDGFNKFIADIDQAAVVVFDEFEKIYTADQQEKVLTLFDGVYPTKKLFVISCNDKYRINSHMKNRPGRFYYLFEFYTLKEEFIIEYCEDRGLSKAQIDDLVKVTRLFAQFNFDMLKAIVEEMIRYDETATEVVDLLNARPNNGDDLKHKVALYRKGEKVKSYYPSEMKSNPLFQPLIHVHDYTAGGNDEDEDLSDGRMDFTREHLVEYNSEEGTFLYEQGEYRMVLTREKSIMDWKSAL